MSTIVAAKFQIVGMCLSIHRIVIFVGVVLYIQSIGAIVEMGHCICGIVVLNGLFSSPVHS